MNISKRPTNVPEASLLLPPIPTSTLVLLQNFFDRSKATGPLRKCSEAQKARVTLHGFQSPINISVTSKPVSGLERASRHRSQGIIIYARHSRASGPLCRCSNPSDGRLRLLLFIPLDTTCP